MPLQSSSDDVCGIVVSRPIAKKLNLKEIFVRNQNTLFDSFRQKHGLNVTKNNKT